MVGRYPIQRVREAARPYGAAQRFGRYESPTGELVLGDTDTFVFDFSGTPDAIYVVARTNAALIKLSDRLGRETSYFEVPVGQPIWLPVTRERVIGKNLVAASAAAVFVTGAWAEPDERGAPAY